jgi:hypothetical protein
MFKLAGLFLLSALTWTFHDPAPPSLNLPEQAIASTPLPSQPTPLMSLLDLREPPPANAYAITGNYLPPFLQAVVSAWKAEFPEISLTTNGVIFVIRPAEFYGGMDAEQEAWLTSREMLGLRNFPVVINPLTPGDDWYLQAQREWKRGNNDAIYILLTSLFHEITHTRLSADEPLAYKEQLALFKRFRKQGKLKSPFARACRQSLSDRYADLRKHPDQYVQVHIRFQSQTVALLVRSTKNSPTAQDHQSNPTF